MQLDLDIKEIESDEFMTFKAGVKPNYVKIEEALIEIGGRGIPGAKFKKLALEKAGWKYGKLISYGAHPDTAADAFNKVRPILLATQKEDEILAQLDGDGAETQH